VVAPDRRVQFDLRQLRHDQHLSPGAMLPWHGSRCLPNSSASDVTTARQGRHRTCAAGGAVPSAHGLRPREHGGSGAWRFLVGSVCLVATGCAVRTAVADRRWCPCPSGAMRGRPTAAFSRPPQVPRFPGRTARGGRAGTSVPGRRR